MFELPEAANSDHDLKEQELSGEYFTKALVCSLFLIYHDFFCIWPSYVEDFVAVCVDSYTMLEKHLTSSLLP
mgnify:CR=1 FL=1